MCEADFFERAFSSGLAMSVRAPSLTRANPHGLSEVGTEPVRASPNRVRSGADGGRSGGVEAELNMLRRGKRKRIPGAQIQIHTWNRLFIPHGSSLACNGLAAI